VGFKGIIGPQVNIAPSRIEGSDFQHHDIEWSKSFANRSILRGQTRIATEEYRVSWRANRQR
jgi:hypothetical protein